MEQAAGHRGYQLKKRPKKYSRLPQQKEFLAALKFCSIKKGISKRELQDKMVNCIPRYFKEHKNDNKDLHSKALQTMPRD